MVIEANKPTKRTKRNVNFRFVWVDSIVYSSYTAILNLPSLSSFGESSWARVSTDMIGN